MKTIYIESSDTASGKQIWKRADTVKLVSDFESREQNVSQRDFAKKAGIARETLRHWLARKNSIDAHPVLIEFFEHPVGIAFLHRLVTSAHVSFTKAGTASIHNVSDFLDRSGLSPFVASSYSAQRRVSAQLDEKIIQFGRDEGQRLARQMPRKIITLCEDETFHPEICLVAIEPVSNFILVERYATNREAKTWDEAVSEALDKFPVEVIQIASDEGRSLISHALTCLKVHHSPDCFHVIHEIGKGTCGALMSKVKKAEKEYEKAVKQIQPIEQEKKRFDTADNRPRGRRPQFEKRIERAQTQAQQAKECLDQARLNHETVRSAKAEIGNVYHPYNIETGRRQDSEIVRNLLGDCFDRIHTATADLSDRCKKRVNKAQRVVNSMVATITFFFQMIDVYLDNMQLSDRDSHLMRNYLIPGYYLKQAARKQRDVDRKAEILQKAHALLSMVNVLDGYSDVVSDCKIEELEKTARRCAQLFQRSSSCVEGRNAQLALRHQGIHRLSDRHLKASTVMHNYYIKRRDGTTAAERFFEAKPNDLFEYLLDNVDYPARPRTRLKLAA
ncbi:DUF6399 domain-containing protein [Desulfosarcina cetonica]|uniref:DUF6399 domain-containing protein n=1 Tax=Desulfosarcina cetonica TaxID=90730 RepID=UPI0012EEA02B|nr:DUF6399 domain-containing protein [Desulfosarcina cetonica]